MGRPGGFRKSGAQSWQRASLARLQPATMSGMRVAKVVGPGDAMAKYGKKAQETVESAMRRRKKGTLRSGSGKKVTSREQAVAIGLSEAREKGAKVPSRKGARKK